MNYSVKNISSVNKWFLLVMAAVAFLGPNAAYLYYAFTQFQLQKEALQNPIALAFILESFLLLILFLWYVYQKTKSFKKVILYFFFSFIGSLAFSFPFFIYKQTQNKQD